MIITIDSGTTNTRLKLFDGKKLVCEKKIHAGAENSGIGGNVVLKQAIKKGVSSILTEQNLMDDNIQKIIASGMITSELGLIFIPHLKAPISEADLSKHIVRRTFPDIASIPFEFITGVKNDFEPTLDELDKIDVMRGEEVETFGILEIENISGPIQVILPGSHTKIVNVDKKNNISSCSTTFTGELIQCISKNTILKNSLNENLLTEIDETYLKLGCNYCRNNGMNQTIFKVRMLKNFLKVNDKQLVNFYVGAVLANDVDKITKDITGGKIVIGGSMPLRGAFYSLIKAGTDREVICLSDETVEMCTSVGAMKISGLSCF